jgi:hypothetical protein
MTLLLLITLAALMLIDDNLGATFLSHNRGHDASLLKPRLSDGGLIPPTDHEHRVKLDPISSNARDFFDGDQIPLGNAVLFPSGKDDSIHTIPTP